ncbi:phenylalanine--tRNA ligase subunit beta [Pseudoprevotella muciniphila]|uniref:Phenylalanine--tRNA ligase beta subunit n=1 Tax=Pseudoprevotella muciniphila TaxID=2133944 RepID=A0A5P8E3T8_9BACT|nr:phenylalanine--tRNA ligase subunit beta [Pseudoprevotella muciniphila]QFQ11606.1 phenylalanine--tRNA ligase subunit beta [Pseudoprevotella muciniphila]
MNISYKWLKEYVDCNLTAQEAAEALTSIGLEVGAVEEVQSIRGGLKGLVVAEVLTCEPHPNSDHMHVTTVNVGGEVPVQIVCGAPNVAAGQKVIVATLGTVLYDGDKEFVIKKSKLRGVESNGMICAEDEIGVGTSHDGIIVLPQDAIVGTPAAEYYNLESDWLIEVDITPNRADGCSHYGVARDLYAWLVRNGYETSLHRPSVDGFKVDNHDLDIDIRIENAEACPRYCGVTIMGCEVKESPEWLQKKLTTIGLRPINNIVDITNYIMFAYGQPLHCFDADMIEGKQVVVKTMPEGTPFVTLDGEEHKLSDRDLAICNAKEPMCIAGVFGGRGSGTYETTTNVLLESAYFHPTWIRKSARRHGLSTDSSFRFERGIDPTQQVYALKAAAMLVKELAGGKISMDVKDIVARELPQYFEVNLDYKYAHDLIGKEIPVDVIKEIVTSLEMKIVEETKEGIKLHVPAYRVDVQRPCDVVEDILRIYGYNNVEIPTSVKSSLTIQTDTDRSNKLQNLISEQLVGCGFHEMMNNSLTKEAYYANLKTYALNNLVKLMNPLSSDLNVLRQTLLFGGLESIRHNANRKMANLAFFEFGNCYRYDETRRNPEKALAPYSEDAHLGLWLTGKRIEGSWAHPDEDSSVFELKAYVMNILTRLGVQLKALLIKEGNNDVFSKSLAITDRNGKVYVEFGQVAKAVTAQFDLGSDVYYADLNWTLIMRATRKNTISFKEISKYPAVSRDLALLVDKTVEFAQIEQIAYATEKKLLKKVTLFDVYEGKNLETGKKSYAVNFTLQDDQKTMNDKQTDAIMQKIINSLEKQLGAKLR